MDGGKALARPELRPQQAALHRHGASGSRVRLNQGIKTVEPIDNGFRVSFDSVVEVEGQERPALVAEQVIVWFN